MKNRRYDDEQPSSWTPFFIKAGILIGLCAAIFIPAWKVAYELFIVPNRPPPEESVEGYQPPPDPGEEAFVKLEATLSAFPLPEQRDKLEEFLDHYPFSKALDQVYDRLGRINADIFFTPTPAPEKERYVIQRGDAIARLERRFKTSRELIMRANNLDDPRRLRIGQVLYINRVDFSVEIDRKTKTVTLRNGHRFFKRYKSSAWDVPEGSATAQAKVRQTVGWQEGRRVGPGSRDYTGSTRWVELTAPGYTFYSESGPVPKGGIAFSDADMEELSTLLEKNVPVFIQ